MKHFRNEIPQKYEAPAIEILEVEVEKGFVNSLSPSPAAPNDPTDAGSSGSGPWSGNGPWG